MKISTLSALALSLFCVSVVSLQAGDDAGTAAAEQTSETATVTEPGAAVEAAKPADDAATPDKKRDKKGPGAKGKKDRRGPGFAGKRPQLPIMKALDADGNGELSGEEILNSAVALKTLDINNDGVLNRSEIRPAGPGMAAGPGEGAQNAEGGRDGEAMMTRMISHDKNKDGKLSADELPEKMARVMTRADKNGDSTLDNDELKAFVAERTGRHAHGPAAGKAKPKPQPE